MQQMHKVLCKAQGKVKTAQVSAQKLAAPGLITSHLCHSRSRHRCDTAGSYLLSRGCTPTPWIQARGQLAGKKRTPHAPTSGQPCLWRKESPPEKLMSSPAPHQPDLRAAPDQERNLSTRARGLQAPPAQQLLLAWPAPATGAAGRRCSCTAQFPAALGYCLEYARTGRAESCLGRPVSAAWEQPSLPLQGPGLQAAQLQLWEAAQPACRAGWNTPQQLSEDPAGEWHCPTRSGQCPRQLLTFPHAHPVRIPQSPLQQDTLLPTLQSRDACRQQAAGSREPGKLQRGSSPQGSRRQLPLWDGATPRRCPPAPYAAPAAASRSLLSPVPCSSRPDCAPASPQPMPKRGPGNEGEASAAAQGVTGARSDAELERGRSSARPLRARAHAAASRPGPGVSRDSGPNPIFPQGGGSSAPATADPPGRPPRFTLAEAGAPRGRRFAAAAAGSEEPRNSWSASAGRPATAGLRTATVRSG